MRNDIREFLNIFKNLLTSLGYYTEDELQNGKSESETLICRLLQVAQPINNVD